MDTQNNAFTKQCEALRAMNTGYAVTVCDEGYSTIMYSVEENTSDKRVLIRMMFNTQGEHIITTWENLRKNGKVTVDV